MQTHERLEKVLSRVSPEALTGCWLWHGAHAGSRFGTFRTPTRSWKVSRFLYQELVQPIPEDKLLLHSCDNEACVNPDHLRVGTQVDNMADMYRRGRDKHNPCRGEAHPSSVLTSTQVTAIREDARSQREMAKEFGIAQQTVSDIKSRKYWKHL